MDFNKFLRVHNISGLYKKSKFYIRNIGNRFTFYNWQVLSLIWFQLFTSNRPEHIDLSKQVTHHLTAFSFPMTIPAPNRQFFLFQRSIPLLYICNVFDMFVYFYSLNSVCVFVVLLHNFSLTWQYYTKVIDFSSFELLLYLLTFKKERKQEIILSLKLFAVFIFCFSLLIHEDILIFIYWW